MIKLVTPAQMREMDRRTIQDVGIPGVVLMEHAAQGAVDALVEHFGPPSRVGILCGGGNNGGDGLAMARLLAHEGVEVVVVLFSDPERYRGEAELNWRIVEKLRLRVHILDGVDEGSVISELEGLPACDVWCDALLGTGLDRPVEGHYAAAIDFLNQRAHVLAVDIPSGLDALTGRPLGRCVDASACVTFGLPKLGQALYPGRACCGELFVVDIGIPRHVVEEVGHHAVLLTEDWVRDVTPSRAATAHKGDAGRLLLLAGSHEMTGAAILCARGALIGGGGLITIGTRPEVVPRIATALPEVMAAEVITDTPTDRHRRVLQSHLDRATIVAMGPGLGRDKTLVELLEHVLLDPRQKLVLDADALNLVAAHELHEALRRGSMRRAIVLTPHPGEMARLVGTSISEILANPVEQARDLAQVTQCVVALKLAATIVAAPDGRLAVNSSGNAGMASGGTGDALTGLLAALLVEHEDPFEATCAAVWLHGAAGDRCRDRQGMRATTASGLLDELGPLLAEFE